MEIDYTVIIAAAFGIAVLEFVKGLCRNIKVKAPTWLFRVLSLPVAALAAYLYRMTPAMFGYTATVFTCMTLGYDNVIVLIQNGISRISSPSKGDESNAR